MENGHRNSGFSHETWWIFPVRYVKLPEGIHQRPLFVPRMAIPGGAPGPVLAETTRLNLRWPFFWS